MILNIPKYDDTIDLDEHIDTYEWTMTSLRMDKWCTYTYFPSILSRNTGKWFEALRPADISSFEKLKYLFLNNFMQLKRGNGDANPIMACKQNGGESIRACYDRFTLATLKVYSQEGLLKEALHQLPAMESPYKEKLCKCTCLHPTRPYHRY